MHPIPAENSESAGRTRPATRFLKPVRTLWLVLVLLAAIPACEREGARQPDCAVDAGPCTRTVDGVTVSLDIAPKPVRAMRELVFSVGLERGMSPITDGRVEIDLSMPGMNMGENRIPLHPDGQGAYHGTGVIVRCPSGSTLWKASVAVSVGDRRASADYLFNAP